MTTNLYWAARPLDECVNECDKRRQEYYDYCQQNGWLWIWGLVHDFTYSATNKAALAYTYGDQGELVNLNVNDFRNLLQRSVGIVINQRPAWECIATNSDYTTLAQTSIAKAVTQYYQEVKGLDHKMYMTTVSTKKFGEGFIVMQWDQKSGNVDHQLPVGVDEDGNEVVQIIHEGDVDARVFEPIDVIRDCSIINQDQNHWYIVRERRNKYDMAMRYPAQYDDIVKQTLTVMPNEHYVTFDRTQDSQDLIYVYTLFHKKTPALPAGRVVQYITPDLILSDSPQLSDDFPVERMVDQPIPNCNFSYTDAFDMLQIQDTVNGLWSTVETNQRAFGVQNIVMPIGSNIPVQSIAGGLNVITYDPQAGGKPEALQLCATPAEVFRSIELLDGKLMQLAGLNAAAVNPPAGTSGIALQFMQTQNVQYNQGAAESYIKTWSAIGTKLINLLKQNAKTERLIEIAGSAKATAVSAFKGDDVKGIARVIARPGNPVMQSIQGRYALGMEIVTKGLDAEASNQLLTVLETGSLDALTEGRFNVNTQIKAENEALRDGANVPVLPFDDHISHLNDHKSITADVNLRAAKPGTKEAAAFAATYQHIMGHLKYLTDPQYAQLLTALGQQPMQQAPQAPAPAQGGGTSIDLSTTMNGGNAQPAAQPPVGFQPSAPTAAQPQGPKGPQ